MSSFRHLLDGGDGHHVHFCRSHGCGSELPLPWPQQEGGAFLPQGPRPAESKFVVFLFQSQIAKKEKDLHCVRYCATTYLQGKNAYALLNAKYFLSYMLLSNGDNLGDSRHKEK